MPKTASLLSKTFALYSAMNVFRIVLVICAVSSIILLCFCLGIKSPKSNPVPVLFVFALDYLALYLLSVSAITPKIHNMPSPGKQQPSRLVILNTDVERILNCSSSTASRKISLVRVWLQKKDHQDISIKEYCDYWGLDYTDTCKFLNLL